MIRAWSALVGRAEPSTRVLGEIVLVVVLVVTAAATLLDVHRAVEKVGVDGSGVMDLPVNSWNAGWYKGSPIPGAPGDSVIEGHAGYPGKPMIFGKLDTLHTGDRIIVVLADG